MVPHFQVYRRNIGHWDVSSKDGRLFRLRGGPGEWEIYDERKGKDRETKAFKDQRSKCRYGLRVLGTNARTHIGRRAGATNH
ncbi:hypothetical protein PsAD37_02285 [Pseudovibrio sp. Ad37]|nr:hypothetical protein PsAD37_02285 [Pseudovibrio sp. Ad37]